MDERTRTRCGILFTPQVVVKNVVSSILEIPLSTECFGTFVQGNSWGSDSNGGKERRKNDRELHDCRRAMASGILD